MKVTLNCGHESESEEPETTLPSRASSECGSERVEVEVKVKGKSWK